MATTPAIAVRTVLLSSVLLAASAVELRVLEDGTPAKITGLGNEALVQGRYDTAIEHYRRALARDKSYFYAIFNLALAHQQLGQIDEAKRWYEHALAVEPENARVLCNLGFIAFRAGDHAGAVARFQDAARLSAHLPSEAADYWFNVGAARERMAQWGEAKRAYEDCLALNDRHYGGHFNLGTLYLDRLAALPGSLDLASVHLGKARDLDGARPEAWINLGLCFERSGQSSAEAAFTRAVEVAPPALVNQARWQRALYYDRSRPPRKTAMRDDLKAILAADADFPEANGRLGAYLHAIGEHAEAIRHLEREVSGANDDAGSPADQEAHYLLAVIYTDHRVDPAKALQHATLYYQMHPDSAKIHDLRRRVVRLGSAEPAPPQPRPTTTASTHPPTEGRAGAHAGHGTTDPHAKPDLGNGGVLILTTPPAPQTPFPNPAPVSVKH